MDLHGERYGVFTRKLVVVVDIKSLIRCAHRA